MLAHGDNQPLIFNSSKTNMNKNKMLQKINLMIDELILAGKTNTEQFKNLTRLHLAVIKEYELRTNTK